MTHHANRPITLAKACTGPSCTTRASHLVNRRALLQGAAGGAATLALFGMPGLTAAQDQPMIDNLNLGSFGGGSNPQINFNPYSPNSLSNWFFEPLYIINDYDCLEIPWLASSYEWRDEQTLVFTAREGVTWHDGEAFGADDIAFTLNLLKDFPALDLNGAWNYLESVTAEGNEAIFTFTEVAIPEFFRMADPWVLILPEHQWSQVEDPLTFLNEQPVGTGPFTFGEFNGEQLTGIRYENYWQADRIRVQQVTWRKAGEGQTDQLRLAEGEYDWNAMYVPNVEQVYVAQDPDNNHFWYAQGSSIGLGMNLSKAPFDDVEFRRGIAWAIDRDKIIQNAQLGYVTQASQTGLKLPGQQDWLNTGIENEGYLGRDLDRARQVLTDAGYTWDGDTMLGLDGNPIEFRFMCPAGWADWIQAGQIVQESLQEIGITVNLETPDGAIHDQDRLAGNYDTFFQVHGGGCNMHANFFDNFHSAMTAPVGEDAITNYIRYQNPDYDALCDQLRVAPTFEEQQPIVQQLQEVFFNELPVVDIWYGAHWFQYRTEKAVGWPNEENPYAQQTDPFLVLINLVPPGEESPMNFPTLEEAPESSPESSPAS
jgi:peptide/nickel transport system substrate-binding protein